jgi:hypothetical protein
MIKERLRGRLRAARLGRKLSDLIARCTLVRVFGLTL